MPNDKKKGLGPGDIKYKQMVADLSKQAIESGAAYDYNKIQAENPVSDSIYSGQETAYDIKPIDYFDPYKDYVAEGTLRGGQFGTEDLNKLRADHQSNTEQAVNAVGRLAVNILPQITAGFASMLDLQGYWDAEHAANNGFVKMADSVKKWSEAKLPIYEENPDEFMQMGDFAWWMTRGEGLVESVGSFLVQGAGVGKAVSLGAKGAAKLLAATMKAKTAKNIVGATSKLTTAAILNQSEAVIEASQVYQTTLDNSLAKGFSYEDAKLKASQAAATTMNLNRVNILLNLTSAGAFLSPQKFTRQLLTAPGLKTVGKEILKEGTQEAAEEVVNYYAQKAGEARGRGVTNYLEQGFKDMDAMEGFEAAFLGAIGGVAQTGGTSALKASKYGPGSIKNEDGTRTSGLAAAREQYTKQQEAIQEMKANGVKITDALMNIEEQQKFEQKLFEASERGDQDEVSNLQSQMFENQVLKAFNTGSTEVLEELYKAEAQRDPAEVGTEYIARANEALKRMAALEDIYNNYEDYANVNEIFFNRATADRVAIQEKNLDALVKNSQVDFGLQVREIADKYKFQHKHEGIIKEDGEEVDRTEFTRESNLTYSLSDLENNHGDTKENRKIYDKFLNEVKKTQAYKVHEGYKAQYDQVSKLRNSLQEQFSEITSRGYQEKVVAEKAEAAKVSAIKNDIFAAKTIPEVEQLAAQTENASVQKLAKERIDIITNQNAAIAKQKKIDLITGELNNKIVQAELDQQEAIEKEIEEAEISQERKIELRNKLANRIKLLNGELVEGTTEIADPLSVFTQGQELEGQIAQTEKDFETTIPVDLPIPSEEVETVENEVITATEALIQQDKTFLVGIDPQGNLIFNYDRSSEGYNRAAYLSREFSQSDSEGIIDREDSTNTIENPQVLGPNNLLAGTKLVLSVDTEYEGQKYDPSSTTRATMSWPARLAQLQQIAAQNGVPVTELNEYIAEVPIKVTLENGEPVFYVHDNAWYREENLNATPEEIAEDRRKNFEIRKAVIKKGIAKSKVDYKSFGRLFKTADGKPVNVSEAMPDSKLIIAIGKDGGFKLPNEAALKGATIINTSKTQEGRPYAIVQVGPKEYLGIPLQRQKLAKEVVDSIMFAVEAHLTNDPNNPVVKAIVEETGLDILETEGLRQYVNQFTYIFPTEKAEGLENILLQGGQKSRLKSNTPIISIIPAGQATEIKFGRCGVGMGSYRDPVTNEQVTKHSVSISRNFEGVKGARSNAAGMDKLRGVLEASLSNVVVENLALNKNAAIIMSADGEMLPITYLQHVKDSHITNVLSANIGTEEKPEWVYTIQPTVLFDTKFAGIDSTKKQRKAKPTQKVETPTITVTPTAAPVPTTGTLSDIEAKKADIERRRQEALQPYDERDARSLEAITPNNPNHPTFKVGMKKNVGDNVIVEKTNTNNWNGEGDGYTVITAIKSPAEFDSEGKMTKAAKIEEGIFNSKEEADAAIQATFEKVKAKVGQKQKEINAKYDAELAALQSQPIDIEAKRADIEKRRSKVLESLENAKKEVYEEETYTEEEKKNFEYIENAENLNPIIINDVYTKESIEKFTGTYKEVKNKINAKYDAELAALETASKMGTVNEEKVAAYRAEEQAELLETIPNIESYKINGEIDKSLMPADVLAKYNKIYDKYDKLITPLLTTQKIGTTELNQVLTRIKNYWKSFLEQSKVNQDQLMIDIYNEALDRLETDPIEFVEDMINKFPSDSEEFRDYQAALNLLKPSASTQVEELTGQALIEKHAKEILTFGIPLKDLEGFVENIENDVVSTEKLLAQKFESRQIALDSYKKAIAIVKEGQSKTVTLPNGITIIVDKTTIDDADPEDDTTIDESIPALEAENIADIKEEAGSLLLNGLGTTEQYSLISYLAADIMQQALNAKEVDGIRKIETAPIFEKHLESLKQMKKLYKEANLPNKAKKVQMVIDQFDKAKALTNQYMSLLTTGSVKEDLNLNDSEQASGLDKLVYSDEWAFTINSKSTASADLRKFFSFVEAKNENGDLITSPLGFPEIIPFDVVYDTLHEILANKPADYTTMIDTLEVYKEKLPWLQSVIDNIEKAPERIQNEFVSDMSKHHISMQFVMWKKNPNGQYSLTRWSSNASAVKERLRRSWTSNMHNPFGGSNLVTVDAEGNYIFDAEVADYLYETAKEWESDSSTVTNDELANWLGNFGIVLTDETYKDLRDGKYKNQGSKSWDGLFTNSAGLVKVLAKKIKDVTNQKINVEQANILNDSAVEALAALDATNNLNIFSNSFRTGGKTVYSYGNNNYLINRMRDLTAYDEENKKFINEGLIEDLNNISFTRDSLWLRELQADSEAGRLMRSNLRLDYVSLEALKQEYRAPKDDSKLKNLNIDEHEIVKLGMFFNASKKIVDGEVRRVASLFYNTMSDKSTMLTMSFLTRQVELEQEGLSEANLELLYEALVQPEVNRMRGEQSKNINGYEPNFFYFLQGLNDQLMIQVNGTEQSFRDIVMAKNDLYFQPEVKEAVLKYLKDTFNTLLQEKLADWETLGIGLTLKNEQGKITDKNTFLDAEYMNKIAQGNAEGKVRYAAADYLFNTLIAGSETYKLFAGDPALYAKFKKGKTLQQNLEETFTNMGKRLAGDIAPGLELANSKGSSYYQVFLADKKLNSNNVLDAEQKAYFNKIVSTYSEDYSGIEGSDAQEYTTWKEHLYVMKQLGRLTQEQFNTLTRKLTNQSNGNFSKENKLNYAESLLVLQPMKPVYVGNVASREDNADRRVYVKSSSFPLIPQLTAGMQLDKLRRALENFEDSKKNETSVSGSPKFVRASFGTANKVGAVNAPIEVFDDKGNVLDNVSITDANTLELPRENFRIQQDVPYDREKTSINIGTQERKLLFVDALDLEISKGRTGQDLMNEYNNAYHELFVDAQDNLSRKLGLIEEVAPDDVFTTFASMTPDATLIDTIAARSEEIAKISSPIKKQTAQQEFADEIGENNLERVNFINKNFDKIVEALTASKINVFFDENDQFKKCD
jgi:hypothetical protein